MSALGGHVLSSTLLSEPPLITTSTRIPKRGDNIHANSGIVYIKGQAKIRIGSTVMSRERKCPRR